MTAGSQRLNNDAQLWSEWVHAHGPAVRGYLLAMVRRPDLADELSQEVFFRAWQARDRYREEGHARAYLMRIADRLVCDRARKLTAEVQVSEEHWRAVEPAGPHAEPAATMIAEEALDQLLAAMDHLSPPQRRVLLLRYYGDLSFAEIAQAIHCPLGTALSHCHRALQTLRELLVEDRP
jgi:RNA polymerase sigma-70 factor (ECF subfamily)